MLAGLVCSAPALAQLSPDQGDDRPTAGAPERRILLLRADDTRSAGTDALIDRALGQALAEMGFLVNVSPMPFRDAQLALGCPGTVRNCGSSVAAELESEQLGVTSVDKRDAETATLRLYLFSPGVEREGAVEIALTSGAELSSAVRELARRVYGNPAPEQRVAAARAQTPRKRPARAQPAAVATITSPTTTSPAVPASAVQGVDLPHSRNRVLHAVGWSTAGVGGALLVSGFATGLSARNSSDAYADRQIDSEADADRALASYARADRQADAARALLGAGGAFVVGGAALLLWERFWPGDRDRNLHFSAMPAVRGVALSLGGSFDGRSR